MATLRDVARLAGVSAMTVSNVINGREGRVSAATVEKVRAAVEEIGYVPNASARSLASCSSPSHSHHSRVMGSPSLTRVLGS